MSPQEATSNHVFDRKPILAIDYGSKFTGLALFTPGVDLFPTAFGRIINKSEKDLLEQLHTVIKDEFIEVIVIGLPYFLDGKETTMTKTIKSFASKLADTFPEIQLFSQDETLSTKEAEERMINSPYYNFKVDLTQIDALSAAIILENFMKAEQKLAFSF